MTIKVITGYNNFLPPLFFCIFIWGFHFITGYLKLFLFKYVKTLYALIYCRRGHHCYRHARQSRKLFLSELSYIKITFTVIVFTG